MNLNAEILAYYNRVDEAERLTTRPSLELIRTQVLLDRFLPLPPATVLDVGGASGVYAGWLAERGYQVHLVDLVPLHVERAAADGRFTAALGDARDLEVADESYDAVLLLGPLYHLTDRADRLRALTEARRAVRPGGVVVAAAISRYASTFDGFFRGYTEKPGFIDLMREALRSGQHRPDADARLFTTAYFHDAAGLATEVEESDLALTAVVPVEGMLHWAPGIADRLADPEQLRLVLDVLAATESDPAMLAATSHLLAIAHRRDGGPTLVYE
ncbi:MAG TPA: class I SAM-dependent methyltransferase [Jiangellaceae bacterium]|nr:class I SAM-dependent methyltransferase [Jiangellaceae bacterium]